jgi:hypothetical protein
MAAVVVLSPVALTVRRNRAQILAEAWMKGESAQERVHRELLCNAGLLASTLEALRTGCDGAFPHWGDVGRAMASQLIEELAVRSIDKSK